MCHYSIKTCYGYDLIVCICRNLSPVYLFYISVTFIVLAATMLMVNKDYQFNNFCLNFATRFSHRTLGNSKLRKD